MTGITTAALHCPPDAAYHVKSYSSFTGYAYSVMIGWGLSISSDMGNNVIVHFALSFTQFKIIHSFPKYKNQILNIVQLLYERSPSGTAIIVNKGPIKYQALEEGLRLSSSLIYTFNMQRRLITANSICIVLHMKLKHNCL